MKQGWQSVGPCRVYTPVPIRPIDLGIRILLGSIGDRKDRIDTRFNSKPTQFEVKRFDIDSGFKSSTRRLPRYEMGNGTLRMIATRFSFHSDYDESSYDDAL